MISSTPFIKKLLAVALVFLSQAMLAQAPLKFTLKGIVRDSQTKEILRNATVTITSSNDTGKFILKTDEGGAYKIDLKPNTDYEIYSSKKFFYDTKIEFQSTKPYKTSVNLELDLYLDPITDRGCGGVRAIYYNHGQVNPNVESNWVLDSLADFMNKYPVTIELASHTDCGGDSLSNMKLSQKRADLALAYLAKCGIDPARIVARGHGENSLAVTKCHCNGPKEKEESANCTEEEHGLNNRTTIKLLTVDYDTPPKALTPPAKVKTQVQPPALK